MDIAGRSDVLHGAAGDLQQQQWLAVERRTLYYHFIRRPEGLNHCSSSPPSPNYFLSSSSFIFVPSLKLKTEKFSL